MIVRFLLLILLCSCKENKNSFPSKKCLSCNLFLSNEGEERFVVLQKEDNIETYKIVLDSVKQLSWQSCNVITKNSNQFFAISFKNQRIVKNRFSSFDELEKYLKQNDLNPDLANLSSAKDIYNILLPLPECK